MRTVIHFSAFECNEENNFIVKELAIVNPDANSFQTWLFKPPFPMSKITIPSLRFANEYLSQHVFGLEWIEGEVQYEEVKNIVTKYTSCSESVYAHGKARQIFLQSLLQRTVINLEDIKCPKYNSLAFPSQSCAHHLHQFTSFRCALKEASVYAKYLTYYHLHSFILPKNRTVYEPTPISEPNCDVE